MFFCRFSPESVDHVASIPGHAFPARRSRTTERSESVSEEAEYPPGQASASYAPEPHLTVFMTDYFIPIPVVPP